MNFTEDIAVLHSALVYGNKICPGGLALYEIDSKDVLHTTILDRITLPLEEILANEDLSPEQLYILQCKLVSLMLVKSMHLTSVPVYLESVTNDLPSMNLTCFFEILRSCSLFPVFYEICSNLTKSEALQLLVELTSHLASQPVIVASCMLGDLCHWLFTTHGSVLLEQYGVPVSAGHGSPGRGRRTGMGSPCSEVAHMKGAWKAISSLPDRTDIAVAKVAESSVDNHQYSSVATEIVTSDAGNADPSVAMDKSTSDDEHLDCMVVMYQLLSNLMELMQSYVEEITSKEEKLTSTELQILCSLCGVALCSGQGFTLAVPYLTLLTRTARSEQWAEFIASMPDGLDKSKLWKMFQVVEGSLQYSTQMAALCDCSAYFEQALGMLCKLVTHLTNYVDRSAELLFGMLLGKEVVEPPISMVHSTSSSDISSSTCNMETPGDHGVHPAHSNPNSISILHLCSLLDHVKKLPGDALSVEVRAQLHSLWSHTQQMCSLDADETLLLSIYKVDRRYPGHEGAFLDLLKRYPSSGVAECLQRNQDLLASDVALSAYVQILCDMGARQQQDMVDGVKILLEAFGKFPPSDQNELLWHLHSNHDLPQIFKVDDTFHVQLTSIFNQLTEENCQQSIAVIGVLALQSPRRVLLKLLNVAISNKKQHRALYKVLCVLRCLCYIRETPGQLPLLLILLSDTIQQGLFSSPKQQDSLIFFTKRLLQTCTLSWSPLSSVRTTSLVEAAVLIDSVLLPNIVSMSTGRGSEDEMQRLSLCIRLMEVAMEYCHNEQSNPAPMLLQLALVVNKCIVLWDVSEPLVSGVKDKSIHLLRKWTPLFTKDGDILPRCAVEWLVMHLSRCYWLVPYYFYECYVAHKHALPWPTSLKEVAMHKHLDFSEIPDSEDGLIALLELMSLPGDILEDIITPSEWSMPGMYPRLLMALAKVLPRCTQEEVVNMSRQLFVLIKRGIITVNTEKTVQCTLTADLVQGISAELQMSQLLNDIFWKAKFSFESHQSNMFCHVTRALAAAYKVHCIAAARVPSKWDKPGTTPPEEKIKSPDELITEPEKTAASVTYLLAHCYVLIARQAFSCENNSTEYLCVTLLDIAKKYVDIQNAVKQSVSPHLLLKQMGAMLKVTVSLQNEHQVALLKTLTTEVNKLNHQVIAKNKDEVM